MQKQPTTDPLLQERPMIGLPTYDVRILMEAFEANLNHLKEIGDGSIRCMIQEQIMIISLSNAKKELILRN